MFPNDSISIFDEISGTVVHTLVSGNDEKTIIGLSLIQSKDLSDTILYCGNEPIAKNYAKDLPFNIVNFQCADDILLSKTGNDESSIILTYVPYFTSDYSTTSQYGYNPSENIASTSDVKVYGSISAGELLIAFMLLVIAVAGLLSILAKSFSAIKTKKRMIEYSSGDVPIHEEL